MTTPNKDLSSSLTGKSTADMVRYGFITQIVGGVVFSISTSISMDPYSGDGGTGGQIVGGLIVFLGSIFWLVALVRVVDKFDDMHRMRHAEFFGDQPARLAAGASSSEVAARRAALAREGLDGLKGSRPEPTA